MDDVNLALIRKTPLSQAVLMVLSHATQDSFLDDLYDRNRGRCYEKTLSFSTLVNLIRDALLQHSGSGRKSCEHAAENQALPVTPSAFYRKLARIPLMVSQALLSETAVRIGKLAPTNASAPIPVSLRGMVLLPVDGKKIKNVAKRTVFLRGLPGAVLGAKVLVALRLDLGIAVALEANPDGEANDCPLVGGLVTQVRQVVQGTRLFIADRQFCGVEQLNLFGADGDHYLIRRTTTARFTPDPKQPALSGTDACGRHYVDCIGTLFTGSQARPMRQITLTRPGEETITLITDLLDQTAFPATDLLDAYLLRWGIERVFQQITEVFSLNSLIGSSPEAVVFQCSFCLVLYNVLRVVRDIIATTHSRDPETVSIEKVFSDMHDQFTALRVMGVLDKVDAAFLEPTTTAQSRAALQTLLGHTWSNRWIKAPPKKKVPKRKPAKKSGAHTSVLRAKQAYEKRQARLRRRRQQDQ